MVLGRLSLLHGLAPDAVILIVGVGDETFMPEPLTINSQMSETLL